MLLICMFGKRDIRQTITKHIDYIMIQRNIKNIFILITFRSISPRPNKPMYCIFRTKCLKY